MHMTTCYKIAKRDLDESQTYDILLVLLLFILIYNETR